MMNLAWEEKTSESFFSFSHNIPFWYFFSSAKSPIAFLFFSGEASSSSKYSVKLAIVQIEIGSPY